MQYPCLQHFAAPSQHCRSTFNACQSDEYQKISVFMINISNDLGYNELPSLNVEEVIVLSSWSVYSRETVVNGLRLPFKYLGFPVIRI